jgi:hypothetical protein
VFDCDFAPASVKATVMYAAIDSAGIETSKRYLTSDDVAGVCAIYPAERDPRVCSLDMPDDGCGCATGEARGGTRGSATASLLALVALLTMGRARPGRRGPTARRG